MKSSFCMGLSWRRYFILSSFVSERIIFCTIASLSGALNMRSVLSSPMPSAPFSLAFLAISGVSAFAMTPSLLNSSAHESIVDSAPDSFGSTSGICLSYTRPLLPSIVTYSLDIGLLLTLIVCAFWSIFISSAPTMHGFPMPLVTTAAWLVIPPLAVSTPSAAAIPAMSSGVVSGLTSITFSPLRFASCASATVNASFPIAAPGEAARPFANGLSFALGSICLYRSCSSCCGSILSNASSFVISPSFTRSVATFTAASAVLFPVLVWSM